MRQSYSSQLNRLVMRILFFLFKRVFYDKDGGPKRCTKCGSKIFGCLVKESINGIPAEQDYICKDCGAIVGFWRMDILTRNTVGMVPHNREQQIKRKGLECQMRNGYWRY